MITIVKNEILPAIHKAVETPLAKLTEPNDIRSYIQSHYRYPSNDIEDYRAEYNLYASGKQQKNNQIREAVKSLQEVIDRSQTMLDINNVEEVIPEQLKEHLIQLLLLDGAMYDIVNKSQEVSAHLSISALLISQTRSNLSYNTGTAIDALDEIGQKIQVMIEILQDHMVRVRT